MKKITPKVSRDDMENARLDRTRQTNPADVEPGMDDWGWDDDDMGFGSDGDSGGWGSSMGSTDDFGGPFDKDSGSTLGGPFGSNGVGGGPFGGGPFGGSSFGSPFGQSLQEQKKDDVEDKFWEATKKVMMGFVTFTGELVKSFKDFDVVTRMRTGKTIIFASIGVAVVGLILTLFGLWRTFGSDFIIAAVASGGIGVILFMFAYDEYQKNKDSIIEPSFNSDPEPDFGDSFSDFGSGFGEDSGFEGEDDDDGFYMGDDEDDDGLSYDFDSDEDEDFGGFGEVEQTDPEEISSNMENTLSFVDIDKGMVTRQYLYETITRCMSNMNKSFDGVKVIHEGSEEFDAWDAVVQNSANLFKPKGSDVEIPYLISAKERLFYVLLEIKRVSWLKNIDSFVKEIVSICSYDDETQKVDETIYGVGSTVGDKIYVKIMKGETAMVTVKDTYKNVEKDILNSDNFMPIVLGLDADGGVVWRDFKNVNSLLVTGMPRSGKSWLVLSILGQMMSFLKPSDLHFYILDPKDQISDFSTLDVPHIRKFVSTDEEILKELRNVVRVEGPRRKKIIGDAGCKNIWDFKKKNPDIEMPLLYVVIDEVITLAERMEKEVKEEFQGLILELVSQLPALGIRIFMIPHVVKDQVLKKSITDLIPCRISVRGDADHIEKSVGVKNFKHRLIHQGDMAVRFDNDEPVFVHSAILTPSNDGNAEFFEFLRKFWLKVEPESFKGSLYERRQMLTSRGSSSRSNIEITSSETPQISVKTKSSSKLDEESVNDLLRGVHGNDIDLWDEE